MKYALAPFALLLALGGCDDKSQGQRAVETLDAMNDALCDCQVQLDPSSSCSELEDEERQCLREAIDDAPASAKEGIDCFLDASRGFESCIPATCSESNTDDLVDCLGEWSEELEECEEQFPGALEITSSCE